MPEVHLPHLEDEEEEQHENEPETPATAPGRARGKTALKLALEVLLIGTGVFLGLAGEQWRESREHRGRAEASLQRFHTELGVNKKATPTGTRAALAGHAELDVHQHSYTGGDAFLGSVAVYLDDATLLEPQLLKMYDELLPKIEAVQHR